MTSALEDELRTALHAATWHITADEHLADRVRAARRRTAPVRAGRRLLGLTLVPIAVVAVVVSAALVLPRHDAGRLSAADQALLDRPTTGDLADDGTVVDQARLVFGTFARPALYRSSSLATPPPGTTADGEPQVLWAGTTNTGAAAVVAQRETAAAGAVLAIGFLGSTGTGLELAAVSRGTAGYGDLAGAFVGTGRRTLIVLDRGQPVAWSTTTEYESGGIRLVDRPVRFTGGVAALAVPTGVAPDHVWLTRPGSPGRDRRLGIGNPTQLAADGPRLPWDLSKQDPELGLFPIGEPSWPEPEDADRYSQVLRAVRAAVDATPSDLPQYGSAGDDLWYAYGGTPDGRQLAVTDMATYDGGPSRAYAVLLTDLTPSAVVSAPVDRTSTVPVRVELPDRQGWVVAAEGAFLTYRIGTGAWLDGGADAALLPSTATAVRADGGAAVSLG